MIQDNFLLDDKITFLNHGSFGACPKPVFKNYQEWQLKLEKQPVQFLTKDLYLGLKKSRNSIATLIGCKEDEVIFFQNPTSAITNIIYNLDLNPGDEVLMSDHEYGALIRAWSEWGKKNKINIIQHEISLPLASKDKFVSDFLKCITNKTKVLFISQITSATGLILPIHDIIKFANERGIITIVDGAHCPGHIEFNVQSLGCDFYTGAIHKWLCGPKGSSFLYVKKEKQSSMNPVIYSWGKDGEDPEKSKFLQDFQWQGTRDMSAFLTIPFTIDYFNNTILPNQNACRKLNQYTFLKFKEVFNTKPIVDDEQWIGQMISYPLPKKTNENIKSILLMDYKIEIPIFKWKNQTFIRSSIHVYNEKKDIDHLISALKTICYI
jgi:isopenicillin-N epimerase